MPKKIVLSIVVAVAVPAALFAGQLGGIETSYHGSLGFDTGLGMLEKWCALPNFSFEQQGGIEGWVEESCNGCHIGAAWNPTKPVADCSICHPANPTSLANVNWQPPAPENCVTCHSKDTSKRGVLFTRDDDVHLAAGMRCQDCHLRVTDGTSTHQLLKGNALDTTEPTMKGTLSCATCHGDRPHLADVKGETLNQHGEKVACVTCHTGLRPAPALASRKWNQFTATGKPVTMMRAEGWLPAHKWYDNTGPGASGDFRLPILGATERRDAKGAKIYPFNPVTVDWFVKSPDSSYDDVIVVPEVKAADADGDRIVTVEEMRAVYPEATLVTADMNFSISHSVVAKRDAFRCRDCHSRDGWVLDWQELGYPGDPRGRSDQP